MYIEIGLLLLLGAFKSLCPPHSSHHDTVTNFFCLFNYYYLFQAVPVNIFFKCAPHGVHWFKLCMNVSSH